MVLRMIFLLSFWQMHKVRDILESGRLYTQFALRSDVTGHVP